MDPKQFIALAQTSETINDEFIYTIDTDVDPRSAGLTAGRTEVQSWHIPRKTALFLRFLILLKRPGTILELGTSLGYSTIWLAKAAAEVHAHVHTIELFGPKIEQARKIFAQSELQQHITLHESTIQAVLDSWNEQIDFLFMDADKPNYVTYINTIDEHLPDGALIVVDNAGNYRGRLEDFVAFCQMKKEWAVHFLSIDNGLLLIIKNGGQNFMDAIDIFSY